jgi:plastocyanin
VKRRFALIAIVMTGLLPAACGGASPTPAGTPAVTMPLTAKNLAFDQATITVPADQTFAIALDNQDGVPHNVAITGNGQSRTSEPFSGPASKTFTFAALPAGTYTFLCSVHTDMHGTVNVTASDSTL